MRVPAQIKDQLEMFNEVDQPTDETGMSKLRQGAIVFDTVFDNGTLTSIDDNGIFEEVQWVPETEKSDDDDYMPEHFYDFCFNIDLLATNDDMCYVDGCMIATEIDKSVAFTVSLMQEMISKEENDMLIFIEEFDEDVTHHVEQEENRPPYEFRGFGEERRELRHLGPVDPQLRRRAERERGRAPEPGGEIEEEALEHDQDQERPYSRFRSSGPCYARRLANNGYCA